MTQAPIRTVHEPASAPVKVVQWVTGTAGLRSLRCILTNPALELAGLYVARPERAGRDAGSFVDLPDTGVITTNDVANIRFQVQGIVRGQPFVILEHVNYCDLDAMPPDWPRPNATCDLAYRTVVAGRPNLTAEISLDYPVAAVRTVNAIPAIVAAPPGIVAGADVPPSPSRNVVLD